jgi:MFS family permease
MPVTAERSQAAPPARRRRGLRALVTATAISSVGDGAFIAAAPLAAAVVTRNPAAVATVTAAEYLPWVLVAPFAGYYVDRWAKRTTMIAADLVRVIVVAVLAALVATGSASIPAIATCAFVIVAGNVFHSAAAEATIADLTALDDELLHAVNGRQQAAYTGGRQLIGPPLGSLTFSLARWLPFAFDAVSFLASALLLALVPPRPATPPGSKNVWRALRASTSYLLAHRDLRTLALLTAAGNFSINMVMGILVLYATDPNGLGITEAGYGLLLAAMAVGGMAGGFLTPRVIRRLGSRTTMIAGLTAQGGAWLVIAATRQPLVAGTALALAYVGVALVSVVVMTTRQKQAPPELLGQVISAFRIVGNGPAPLGALAGGVVAEFAGLRAPILAAAVVALLAVLLVLRVRPSNGR